MSLLRPQMGPFCSRSEAMQGLLDLRTPVTVAGVGVCARVSYRSGSLWMGVERGDGLRYRRLTSAMPHLCIFHLGAWRWPEPSGGEWKSTRGGRAAAPDGRGLPRRAKRPIPHPSGCARPLRAIVLITSPFNADASRAKILRSSWTRNAFFSLGTFLQRPWTISTDNAP